MVSTVSQYQTAADLLKQWMQLAGWYENFVHVLFSIFSVSVKVILVYIRHNIMLEIFEKLWKAIDRFSGWKVNPSEELRNVPSKNGVKHYITFIIIIIFMICWLSGSLYV